MSQSNILTHARRRAVQAIAWAHPIPAHVSNTTWTIRAPDHPEGERLGFVYSQVARWLVDHGYAERCHLRVEGDEFKVAALGTRVRFTDAGLKMAATLGFPTEGDARHPVIK